MTPNFRSAHALCLALAISAFSAGCSGEQVSDFDADGSTDLEDCDPADPEVYPGAEEACDSVDSDCDGSLVDEFADLDSDLTPDCVDDDADGDGFLAGADCNDLDADSFPGGSEVCDGEDNDCDGEVPTVESDVDQDGVLPCSGDCGPDDSSIYPGAPEDCDALDSDCDGDFVDGFDDLDADGIPDCVDDVIGSPGDGDADGYGDGIDCGPSDPLIHPGAEEVCDGVDQDCDGSIVDEFPDLDMDGVPDCIDDDVDGDGIPGSTDCDDSDGANYPGNQEICDGQDNDCSGSPDADALGELDGDSDGLLSCNDCDDADPNSTAISSDADCDGTVALEDCDDEDSNSTVTAQDADCDGVVDCLATADVLGATFFNVCPGTFDMGCTLAQQANGNCNSDEVPSHPVTLTRPLWTAQTEVTQSQWQALFGTNPSYYGAQGWAGLNGFGCTAGDCPVDSVSWYEALEFANALSVAEGLPPCFVLSGCSGAIGSGCLGTVDAVCPGYSCSSVSVSSSSGSPYDCAGYRLPTEAEWEYVARAGTDLLYAGSDDPTDVAWYGAESGSGSGCSGCGTSGGVPQPVSTLQGNGWGLFDLSGNVWEWTWDGYDAGYYATSPAVDPLGAAGPSRTLRGGSASYYNSYANQCRVSSRYESTPGNRWSNGGIRVVRSNP